MLIPQLQKVKVFTFNSKQFDWKDFIIEGNTEGACGGGEGPIFIFFNFYCGWNAYPSFYACHSSQDTLVALANLVPDTITSLFEPTYITCAFLNQPRGTVTAFELISMFAFRFQTIVTDARTHGLTNWHGHFLSCMSQLKSDHFYIFQLLLWLKCIAFLLCLP